MSSQIALVYQPGDTLEQIKVEAMRQALHFHNGNKTAASQALGMSIRTLRIYVKEFKELEQFRISQRFYQRPRTEHCQCHMCVAPW